MRGTIPDGLGRTRKQVVGDMRPDSSRASRARIAPGDIELWEGYRSRQTTATSRFSLGVARDLLSERHALEMPEPRSWAPGLLHHVLGARQRDGVPLGARPEACGIPRRTTQTAMLNGDAMVTTGIAMHRDRDDVPGAPRGQVTSLA